MKKIKFASSREYIHFTNKENFETKCPGLEAKQKDYYLKNRKLPPICDKCYKATIFWANSFSEQQLKDFKRMLCSFDFEIHGKFDQEILIFYLDDKDKLLNFLEILKEKMKEFKVNGIAQWRRACKEYQDLKPEWWKNAKEFIY